MEDPSKRPTFCSAIIYEDPTAALKWLEEAFGFEPSLVITDADGNLAHSEMGFGDGYVMIGSAWNEVTAAPRAAGGKNTQTVHVQLKEGIDAHCERARKAGAVIRQEPEDQFYGDRTYRAVDPEGHVWTFGQTVRTMTPEEWDKAGGVVTKLVR
jgi:uncharacterized glyoxalase superfamily protein PhnB